MFFLHYLIELMCLELDVLRVSFSWFDSSSATGFEGKSVDCCVR